MKLPYSEENRKTFDLSRFMMQGQIENTRISQIFFSKDNIEKLQKGIQEGVLRKSNNRFRVSKQNETNLVLVMQHIYFEEVHYVESDISTQLSILNQKVLDYCIENVYKNYIHYAKYYRDSHTLQMPMDRPLYSRENESKTLEFKGWF